MGLLLAHDETEGDMSGEMSETADAPRPTLDADSAAWLQDRLRSLARLVRLLGMVRGVTADAEMVDSAMEGAIRGQARQIAGILRYIPGENLEPFVAPDSKGVF